METETVHLKDNSTANSFIESINEKEIVDRTLENYLCTLSRGDNEIIEKTYETKNGKFVYLISNLIAKNHPRYPQLNLKLNSANL